MLAELRKGCAAAWLRQGESLLAFAAAPALHCYRPPRAPPPAASRQPPRPAPATATAPPLPKLAETPGLLAALCGCLTAFPDDPVMTDAACNAIGLMCGCHRARAAVLAAPGLVDTLSAFAARNDGRANGHATAFATLSLAARCLPERTKAWAADKDMLAAAVRAAARAEGHNVCPARVRALDFLTEVVQWAHAHDVARFAAVCATPRLALTAARLLTAPPPARDVRWLCTRMLSVMLDNEDDAPTRRLAASAVASSPGALEALLGMLADTHPRARVWAAAALQGAAFEDVTCARLLAAPGALPALVAALARPLPSAAPRGGAGAPPAGLSPAERMVLATGEDNDLNSDAASWLALEALHFLSSAAGADWHEEFLRLCVPPAGGGAALAALVRHMEAPDSPAPFPAASALALICERAAAAGPARLRGVSRAPGLASAAAAALARATAAADAGAFAHTLLRQREAGAPAVTAFAAFATALVNVRAAVGNLSEALSLMTGPGAGAPVRGARAAAVALRGWYGIEGTKGEGEGQSEDEAAGLRLAARLEDAAARGPACAACGAVGVGCKLLRCTRCYGAAYCNAVCQKAHWGDHRRTCVAVAAPQEAAEAAPAQPAAEPAPAPAAEAPAGADAAPSAGAAAGSSGGGPAAAERSCRACGKGPGEAPEGKLRACRGCRAAWFCSTDCYQRAWSDLGHRAECKQLRQQRAQPAAGGGAQPGAAPAAGASAGAAS